MKNNAFETLIGAAVVAIAGLFLFYTYTTTDSGPTSGYELTARFNSVDGVTPGSDVRMSGIKIGTVNTQELDMQNFMAVVSMTIRADVQLPEDSSIKVASESLLGGSYLDVDPGGSEDLLIDGDEIAYTQGTVSLMDIVGQAITAVGGSGDSE